MAFTIYTKDSDSRTQSTNYQAPVPVPRQSTQSMGAAVKDLHGKIGMRATTQMLAFECNATGVQRYVARNVTNPEKQVPKAKDAKRFWSLEGPEAMLFDDKKKTIGGHYIVDPGKEVAWSSRDGSKVVADLSIKDAVDSPAADAVQWLILGILKSSGRGVFADVKRIERIHTVGGKPPAPATVTPEQVASNARCDVDYQAHYRFYVERNQSSPDQVLNDDAA